MFERPSAWHLYPWWSRSNRFNFFHAFQDGGTRPLPPQATAPPTTAAAAGGGAASTKLSLGKRGRGRATTPPATGGKEGESLHLQAARAATQAAAQGTRGTRSRIHPSLMVRVCVPVFACPFGSPLCSVCVSVLSRLSVWTPVLTFGGGKSWMASARRCRNSHFPCFLGFHGPKASV